MTSEIKDILENMTTAARRWRTISARTDCFTAESAIRRKKPTSRRVRSCLAVTATRQSATAREPPIRISIRLDIRNDIDVHILHPADKPVHQRLAFHKRDAEWFVRPSTIFVTPLTLAYSAICTAGSSPYTVATRAPNCSARRILSRRRFRFSPFRSLVSGVSTNSAGESAVKGLSHAGCRADHLCVGWRTGKAGENVFPGFGGSLIFRFLGFFA